MLFPDFERFKSFLPYGESERSVLADEDTDCCRLP